MGCEENWQMSMYDFAEHTFETGIPSICTNFYGFILLN